MPRAITLRSDFNASNLRRLTRRSKDAPQARRPLALTALRSRALAQADQPTMAHHVHRAAELATWVLINGSWYKTAKLKPI